MVKLVRILNTYSTEQLEAINDMLSYYSGDEVKGMVRALVLLRKDEDGDSATDQP